MSENDTYTDGTEHEITREFWARGEDVFELSDGGLEAVESRNKGPVDNKSSYECSCGRRFYYEHTAAEHLRSVQPDAE